MPCVNCVERCEYDRIVKERDEYREQIKTLRSQLEGARETSKHYAEQAAHYQSERDRALEDAKRHREDYTKLTDKYAKLEKLRDDFCIQACAGETAYMRRAECCKRKEKRCEGEARTISKTREARQGEASPKRKVI